MIEQTGTKSTETDEHGMANHSWKRRGLIAAAWAAVAALVARQTTAPVEAGDDGDVVLGAQNWRWCVSCGRLERSPSPSAARALQPTKYERTDPIGATS
jgi:acyl-CoA reductase-like NAD-dependent aldehyde dehydrogenase